jgi:hypothetical protein
MRRLFWLLTPALLCAALAITIGAPQVALARGSGARLGSAVVSHVDDNPVAVIASPDVAQQGRARGQAPPPPPDRQDFRRRHDAEGAVPQLADSIRVRASAAWTDSRITVRRGQRVSFQAVGTVFYSLDEGAMAGPDGIDNGRANRRQFPVRQLGVCALIGRVGNGAPFPIGSNSGPIAMPVGGRLYLGVNDSEFNDNAGFFRVRVRVQ